MITIAAGKWGASLRPEIGGSLAALEIDGIPLLREMAEDATHPLQSACFPLVPYCNRIAHGRFTFRDRAVSLSPNLPPQRHPLHGLGWLRPWRVVRQDASSALLEDDYTSDGEWPWAYRAHQHIALDETGCTIRLMVENRSSEVAPLGLGLHPYFRRSDDSVVGFDADAMLGIDSAFLPDGSNHRADHLAPWSDGATAPDELVDHCFTGWSGTAKIADSRGTIRIRGFGTPHCHVFMPPGGEELCVEPVAHTPDALNRAPDTMAVVQPGCATGIALRIEADNA